MFLQIELHHGNLEVMTLPGYQTVLSNVLYAKNIGWGPHLGLKFDPKETTVDELGVNFVIVSLSPHSLKC